MTTRTRCIWPIAISVAVLLTGCGSEDESPATSDSSASGDPSLEGEPTRAVQELLKAQDSGECEAYADSFTDDWIETSVFGSREEAIRGCEALPETSVEVDYQYVSEEIDGDTATVGVTGLSDVELTTYELVLEDGEWLVDNYEHQE